MKLRKEIDPDFETAEKLYPEVLRLVLAYAEYCDENGDEGNIEYVKLTNTLHQMTGKDMSQYDLSEWWEGEGAEVLAFRISLPAPKAVRDIIKEELSKIVKRLKSPIVIDEDDANFKSQFSYYLDDYYYSFLKLNFATFDISLFQRNKDKNVKYFEYEEREIVERLWNGKIHSI